MKTINKIITLLRDSNLLIITKTSLKTNLNLKNSLFIMYSNFIKNINVYKRIKMFYILLTSLNLIFTFLVAIYYSYTEWEIFTPLVLILGFLSKITPVFIEELIIDYYLMINSFIKTSVKEVLLKILDLDKISPNNITLLNETEDKFLMNETPQGPNENDNPIPSEEEQDKNNIDKTNWPFYIIGGVLLLGLGLGLGYWYFYSGSDLSKGGEGDKGAILPVNKDNILTEKTPSGSTTPKACPIIPDFDGSVSNGNDGVRYTDEGVQTNIQPSIRRTLYIQTGENEMTFKGGENSLFEKVLHEHGVQTTQEVSSIGVQTVSNGEVSTSLYSV
jgi:hypothetical protein